MEKMTFIVTNSCNLRCKHCFVDAGLKIENELSIEEKYKAIDNLHKLGIKKVTFSGGEPLLDKNLFKYMKYVKDKKMKIGFLTNGLLLTDEKLEILKELVDSFSITFYTRDIVGMNIDIYNNYFQKTLINLKKISNMKFSFKITIPISKTNQNEAKELVNILYNEKIKPKTVRVYMRTPIGRGKKHRDLCTENFNCLDFYRKLPENIKKSDFNISIEYSSVEKNTAKDIGLFEYCTLLKYSSKYYINRYGDPHMDANGDLYLCGLLMRNKKYCIGNIIKNTKEEIIKNIDFVVDLIRKREGGDCCPSLNRNSNECEELVCPVIYNSNNLKGDRK